MLIIKKAESRLISLGFILLLVFSWWVFQPAIPGPFLLDDSDNLEILGVGVSTVDDVKYYLANSNAGPLGRPISKLSFLINDNAWPSLPNSFKRTNLLIHLLIGVLLFAGLRLLFATIMEENRAHWWGLFCAGLFLLHPIQVSTVMYVVQRMTQLASMFIVAGVLLHCHFRIKFSNSPSSKQLLIMSVTAGFMTILAALSKENGLLLPVYILVVEFTLFSKLPSSTTYRWWRGVVLGGPAVLLTGYLLNIPRWEAAYSGRDFTLHERLLTQLVVLKDYVVQILSFRVHGLSLFHDAYPIYSSLWNAEVIVSFTLITCLLILAIWLRKRWSLLSFGILWFFTGHLLESTTVPLELYFEHRNYLAVVGLAAVIAALLIVVFQKFSSPVIVLAPSLLLLLGFSTWGYAKEWSSIERLIPVWVAQDPESPRARRTYAQVLALKGLYASALLEVEDAYRDFPDDMSLPIMSLAFSCISGLPHRQDIDTLITLTPEHKTTDGLRPAVTSLFNMLIDGHCPELVNDAQRLLSAFPNLGDAKNKQRLIFSLQVKSGELYASQKDYYPALLKFASIDEKYPTYGSALRLSDLYLMMGEFGLALQFLEAASEREAEGSFGLSSDRQKEYSDRAQLIGMAAASMKKYQEKTSYEQ